MRKRIRRILITWGVCIYTLSLAGVAIFVLCINDCLPTAPWLAIATVSLAISMLFMLVINGILIKRPNATPKEWVMLKLCTTILYAIFPIFLLPIDKSTATATKWLTIISTSLVLIGEFASVLTYMKKSDAYSTSGYNKEEKRH